MLTAFMLWIIRDCLFLLGYISGRQNFPKPLNAEEEREALLRMREGDEDARQKLIEHNMRLIVHVARKYKIPGCTFDDLISIGSIGLIKPYAATTWIRARRCLPTRRGVLKMKSSCLCARAENNRET